MNAGSPTQPGEGFVHLLMEEIWPRIRSLKPNGVRARPAATLILIDRSGPGAPKVLMGRRNPANRFMPDKFVFPGGQVDAADQLMPASGALATPVEQRLARARGQRNARAIALAAIRETFEETGLLLGAPASDAGDQAPEGGWRDFAGHGLLPDLAAIHFVGRAITPPRMPRRFDTFFLAAEADRIGARIEGTTGPDKELVELAWVRIAEAHDLDLPLITSVILRELELRLAAGLPHDLPAPCYRVVHPGGWRRTQM